MLQGGPRLTPGLCHWMRHYKEKEYVYGLGVGI